MHSLGNNSLLRFVVVWERWSLYLLNKRVNCKQELFFISLPGYLLHLVPVTRIEFRRINGRGDGWRRTTKGSTRSILTFFLHNENQSTIKIQTYNNKNPPMLDGVDRMEDASRILVWGTPRTTGCGGLMKIASASELILPSVLGEPLIDCLQEPMSGEKNSLFG